MRVLQVVLSLNPGGTERLVVELVKRLHAGSPMAVCCLDEKGAWASEVEAAGVPVHEFRRRAGFAPSVGRAVARMARQHRADVLHCHHYSPFVYGALARLWHPRSRVVFTEHGRLSDAKPSRRRRRVNRLLRHVPGAVFAVSEDLRAHLLGEGFRPADVRVVYNGIEVGPLPSRSDRAGARHRLGVPDESTLVIGTIARLDPVKDLGTLLRAAAHIQRQRPTCVAIVGDGPERPALEAQAVALGLTGAIRFLGARDDARAWLAGCDVYVNSSVSEGVSLTILEAMAASLPVVATRVGGTPEVVNDACARLVPARDPAALGSAIEELAGDRELRCRLGAAARRRVEEHFSLDRMVASYRDAYAAVAGL